MSTTTTMRIDGLIGEGGWRLSIVGLALAGVLTFVLLPALPDAVPFDSWLEAKSPTIYIVVLTVLVGFVAAVLTIWTLMKTRASRYVERLADSAVFGRFMSAFEVRLAVGAFAVVLTGVVTVADPRLTAARTIGSASVLVWAFVSAASILLLTDSLLTARKLL